MSGRFNLTALFVIITFIVPSPTTTQTAEIFKGHYFQGQGDFEYLQLLDVARRMFEPDPEFQNLPMLYTPSWNGLVEGPQWGMWWVQNSYGPTFCVLPFLTEPYITFLQNSQNCWFDNMGDGKTKEFKWGGKSQGIVPDGQLCDAATPGGAIYKQGDGNVAIHDWGMEFTAAGAMMQSELLLISRNKNAIADYLPKLERCADFIESRRDPENNLFFVGPAGNLLAPSYAGWKKPDGSYDKAYLSGLSVTYIALLDRLIELEKLSDNPSRASVYIERRTLARQGIEQLTTDEGYLIKYLDPGGVKHGVYGAEKHGYFEAVCNHDAICFRIFDDSQSRKIYNKIVSIPGLRPHDFIITNYPALDDMYEFSGIFQFGTWINGGHWSTCEARMIMAYYRLGEFDDARRSMLKLLTFAQRFQMDNPLKNFGNTVWFENNPINLCYDNFGPPAALIRGLFEYIYSADSLTLIPHIPSKITKLKQDFPIRFGRKKLFIATTGSGSVTAVKVNSKPWESFDKETVTLRYDQTPDIALIQIALGKAPLRPLSEWPKAIPPAQLPSVNDDFWTGDWLKTVKGNERPLRIGADSNGQNRFLGHIDEVMIFARTLLSDEILALFQDKDHNLMKDPSLIGYWPFNKQIDKSFVNLDSDNFSAKAVGSIELVASPHIKAIQFSGSSYLEIAHDHRLNLNGNYTLVAWVKPKELPPGGARIIDKSIVGTSDNYLLDTYPGNSLRLITRQGTISYDAKLPTNRWSHVAATFDSQGKLILYLNGKAVVSCAANTIQQVTSLRQLQVLAGRISRFYDLLDEMSLTGTYEAAHAKLALNSVSVIKTRLEMLKHSKIKLLPTRSQAAADASYLETASKICSGLNKVIQAYANAADPQKKTIYNIWLQARNDPEGNGPQTDLE
ncbi:LamG-like jellyroll fold domain-containing protein [Planctomycetota bacterium]